MGHTAELRHAEFSPDGSYIVTTSDDGTARLWDSEGKELAVFAGGGLYGEFSPDGSRILTGARLFRVPATTPNSSTGPPVLYGVRDGSKWQDMAGEYGASVC